MVTPTEKIMMLILVGIFIIIFLAILFVSFKKIKWSLSSNKNTLVTPQASRESVEKREKAPALETHEKALKESMSEPVGGALLEKSLERTRSGFWSKLHNIFGDSLEQKEVYEKIEEVLYTSDLGPQVVTRLLDLFEGLHKDDRANIEELKKVVLQESLRIFSSAPSRQDLHSLNFKSKPCVILVVGVNGAGKTTTIGKLASKACGQGHRVLVAAGDTFRAAASEQLAAWAERAQVEVFAPDNVKDPGAVAFAAIEKAQKEGFDLVLVDTAGRLHTSQNLMEELKKVNRVIQKADSSAPHEVLLVLDASGGQNAIIQAEQFNNAVPVTGVVLTKLDGTAKGGMALGMVDKLKLPIVWLGVGEKTEDLVEFDPEVFAKALVSEA